MRKRPELLAPAGDMERLKMAVAYGADAVYLAGTSFGMRSFAGNFTPEELPKVKDRFYKGKSTRRGSGIGLALVDEIVRLHGGRMEMDSEPGVGTAVTVLLPVAEQE